MTSLFNQLGVTVIRDEEYIKATNNLFAEYISSITGEHLDKLTKTDVKKLVSTAQIFFKADDEDIKSEGAILLAILLDLYGHQYPEIAYIANNVFADSGNFPNISLVEKRYPKFKFVYNFFSEAQREFRKSLNHVPEFDWAMTDYQRRLWEDLIKEKDIITAAPTSAGKTYVILNYLLHKVSQSSGAFVAIVVPTRALITEVANKIYEIANEHNYGDEIDICTISRDGEYAAKTFFVMTQERLHEVLLRGDVNFDYLFIDEAQNIADKSRGVLLHITIEKLLEGSTPQIIISMPSEAYQDSFSTIFNDIEFEKEITNQSPVSKIIMSVIPKGKKLIISRHDSENVVQIEKGFNKSDLADIIYKLGSNQTNIIYRNKTNDCENLADKLANKITYNVENTHLTEAADYIEKFIHEKFSLAATLKKGVAFHYGPLPSSVRVMVERLAKENHIKFITCTSTLAEGVNLPAKNLFLCNPLSTGSMGEGTKRLDDVKINNITGRAGRMLQHFSGNIFLISPDKWSFKDYFDKESDPDVKKIPTYFKSLNEEFDSVLEALRGEYSHSSDDQYRVYTIANKLIKEFDSDNFSKTLNAEELTINENHKFLLFDSVAKAIAQLRVASFTLEANPTIGFIQQNKLFQFLESEDDISKWLIPHPKSPGLYEFLLMIARKLWEVGIFIPSKGYSIEFICIIARKWILGHSLKEIINEQIGWDLAQSRIKQTQQSSPNKCIRDVMGVINTDIRFRLANAIGCFESLLNTVLADKNDNLSNVKLHSYMEIGASDQRMINLLNMGLSREASKEIDDVLPKDITVSAPKELQSVIVQEYLKSIHTITQKEIQDLFK